MANKATNKRTSSKRSSSQSSNQRKRAVSPAEKSGGASLPSRQLRDSQFWIMVRIERLRGFSAQSLRSLSFSSLHGRLTPS